MTGGPIEVGAAWLPMICTGGFASSEVWPMPVGEPTARNSPLDMSRTTGTIDMTGIICT